jgi:diacylglycerol kinase family enzyme
MPAVDGAADASYPVLLMNPRSGGGKSTRLGLVERCRALGVEPVELRPADALLELAEAAVERGCDLLGMAGGDGSQALVASVAARHRVPLVVIPAGTRNHFARDLGVGTDVAAGMSAFVEGVDVAVDLGEVNGRVFVNNVSMGAYAELVRSPQYRAAKFRTAVELLPQLVGPSAAPTDLRFGLPTGEQATAALVLLVSNNPYHLSALRQGAGRPSLDGGLLGVLAVRASGPSEADQMVALDAIGQTQRFDGWHEWTTTELDVASGRPVPLGIDGESVTLDAPLRFVSRPRTLVVRVPRLRATPRSRPLPAGAAPPSPLTLLSRLAAGREA